MDAERVVALIALLAGAFKAVTSGLKDLDDISKKQKKKKRRSPTKKKRRK